MNQFDGRHLTLDENWVGKMSKAEFVEMHAVSRCYSCSGWGVNGRGGVCTMCATQPGRMIGYAEYAYWLGWFDGREGSHAPKPD